MKEYDDPLTVELQTEREVAVYLQAVGMATPFFEDVGMVRGAAALSNLQIRLIDSHESEVIDALNEYDRGGGVLGTSDATDGMMQQMSTEAAVSQLAEQDELDPDSIGDGGL